MGASPPFAYREFHRDLIRSPSGRSTRAARTWSRGGSSSGPAARRLFRGYNRQLPKGRSFGHVTSGTRAVYVIVVMPNREEPANQALDPIAVMKLRVSDRKPRG